MEKQSSNLCSQCKHITRNKGREEIKIVNFPRYLIIFLEPLDSETGGLKHPLNKIKSSVDLTKYKQESMDTLGKKIKYDLLGILSHEKTSSKKQSMYTAVVKKRMKGEQ